MPEPRYDSIADVYDETRRPLDPQTLEGMKRSLASKGCRTVLEVGVGTGRVSVPLIREGFAMTGIDISARMMERARSKGHQRLIRGDGVKTPFRDASFDAVVLAHVIHLVEDPCRLVAEGRRVARVGVFALMRKRAGSGSGWLLGSGGGGEEMRDAVRRIAAKYGWEWDRTRGRGWPGGREEEMLKTCPPDGLDEISDVLITETIEDRVAWFQKGAFGFSASMPPEMREEVAAELRRRSPPRRERREVYRLAFWGSK